MVQTVNLIGAGKLGSALIYALNESDQYVVQRLVARTYEKAQQQASQLPVQAGGLLTSCQSANWWIITTPDQKISAVAQQMSELALDWQNSIVVHMSGALGASVLAPLAQQGARIASIHPTRSFHQSQRHGAAWRGCYCAIETNDDTVFTEGLRLLAAIGAKGYRLLAENKAGYHAAAVLASNGLLALADAALQGMAAAAVPEAARLPILMDLWQSTRANLQQAGQPAAALTGPVQRGDVETIEAHMADLAGDAQKFYQSISRHLVQMCRHDEPLRQALLAALQS